MSVISKLQRRSKIYEERTGDMLPLNIVAKIGQIAGIGLFTSELVNNGTSFTRNTAIAGFILASTMVDKYTGGLRGYSDEALRLEKEQGY